MIVHGQDEHKQYMCTPTSMIPRQREANHGDQLRGFKRECRHNESNLKRQQKQSHCGTGQISSVRIC